MKFRTSVTLVASLAIAAGLPAFAQDARPAAAPGVDVERLHKLMVGDRAPELAIGEWVKGDEITGFEEGKVYVVEFWATWCGPCIAGMPHISDLQEQYKDKGVTVIGVNIWDDPEKVEPFMIDRGDNRQGEKNPSGDELMQYTVAIEEKIEGEDIRSGRMAQEWMSNAGRRGIPSAFIVDQSGYIAWMGHPMQMDDALEGVVKGEWDIREAATEHVDALKAEVVRNERAERQRALLTPFMNAIRDGKHSEAWEAAGEAIGEDLVWDDDAMLNYIAWQMVDPDVEIEDRGGDLAVKIAERACELTGYEQPMILDTLAWAYHHAGDSAKAIETQKKAIELAPKAQKADYEASLERMKK